MVVANNSLMDRLAGLLERNGQAAVAAEVRGLAGSGSRGGAGGAGGGLAAGTPPNRFDHGRSADDALTTIESDDLYSRFDPAGLDKKWTEKEVARVVSALPDLNLPYRHDALAGTIDALGFQVVQAGLHFSNLSQMSSRKKQICTSVMKEQNIIVKNAADIMVIFLRMVLNLQENDIATMECV